MILPGSTVGRSEPFSFKFGGPAETNFISSRYACENFFSRKKKKINLNPFFNCIILHNGKITSCPVSTLVLKIKLIYVVNFDGTQTIMYTRPQIFEDLIRRLQITIVKHQSIL